jgi:hypothetical protein
MERNFVDGYVEWQANPEITGVNRLPQHGPKGRTLCLLSVQGAKRQVEV